MTPERRDSDREERVDRTVWRFLLSTFAVLVTLLVGISAFSLKNLYAIVQEGQRTDAQQAKEIGVLQTESKYITQQQEQQQRTAEALTLTVQALHDEVVRNSVTTHRSRRP